MSCDAGAGAEHIGDQHRVVEGADIDAVAVHRQPVVFEVVADLQHRAVRRAAASARPAPRRPDLVVGAAAAQQIRRAGAVRRPECRPTCPAATEIAKPTGSARIGSSEVVSVRKATMPVSRASAIHASSVGAMADAGITLVVDLGAGDRLRPRAGKGRRRIRSWPIAAGAPAGAASGVAGSRRRLPEACGAPAPTSGPCDIGQCRRRQTAGAISPHRSRSPRRRGASAW